MCYLVVGSCQYFDRAIGKQPFNMKTCSFPIHFALAPRTVKTMDTYIQKPATYDQVEAKHERVAISVRFEENRHL